MEEVQKENEDALEHIFHILFWTFFRPIATLYSVLLSNNIFSGSLWFKVRVDHGQQMFGGLCDVRELNSIRCSSFTDIFVIAQPDPA